MHKMSWEKVELISSRLSLGISNSGFKPDLIIAIKKGGLAPALLASYFFLNAGLETVGARHYDPHTNPVKISVAGLPSIGRKRVLVVDDVCETGSTFQKVMKELGGKSPREIKTACLVLKKKSSFTPDFFGIRTGANIAMPWYSFSKKIMRKK